MSKLVSGLAGLWNNIKRNKYATLILILGIGLFLLPASGKEKKGNVQEKVNYEVPVEYELDMEKRISAILSQIEGVGKVEVILTLKQGAENHFLMDQTNRTESKDAVSIVDTSEKTVIISKGNSYDEAMITRTDYPLFQGALIVCEGGGDAEIKLQLTQAVAALTNLSSHNITILKMK